MARVTPSALVGSISGKLGGVEFASGAGGQFAKAAKFRSRGVSAGQYAAGNSRANFEAAWRALDNVNRGYYANLARASAKTIGLGWQPPRNARECAWRRWMCQIWQGAPGGTMASLSLRFPAAGFAWVFPYQLKQYQFVSILHVALGLNWYGQGYPNDPKLWLVCYVARGLRYSGQAPRGLRWIGAINAAAPAGFGYYAMAQALGMAPEIGEWVYSRAWFVHEDYIIPGNVMEAWTECQQ